MNSKLKIQKKWQYGVTLEALDPIFLRILFVKDN